jgi:hypothetical protein
MYHNTKPPSIPVKPGGLAWGMWRNAPLTQSVVKLVPDIELAKPRDIPYIWVNRKEETNYL